MLPQLLTMPLREHLVRVRALHTRDIEAGFGRVYLPYALARKYPRAGASWTWFWVFPQATHSTDPRTGIMRRHHMYDQTFQHSFKRTVEQAGMVKPASPHTLPFICHALVAVRLRHPHGAGTVGAF